MENKVNQNIIGLNLDSINWQVKENQITWALNANVQSHDGNSVTYTNEPGNTPCYIFNDAGLEGFQVVGVTNVIEQSKVILFLTHPDGRSRIGQITSINDSCLEVTLDESRDCGCASGKSVNDAVVGSTIPASTVTYSCPEGFVFDPDSNQCVKEQYTIPSSTSITYACSAVSTNSWGNYRAALYQPGWSSNGVGSFVLLPTCGPS